MTNSVFAIKTIDGFVWQIEAPPDTTLPKLISVIRSNGFWMDDNVYIALGNIATVVPAQHNQLDGNKVVPFKPSVVEPPTGEATE